MRDSSLDDFLRDRETDGDGDADTDASTNNAEETVTPTVSTYDWTPTGAACANCGTVVERRWRDGADSGTDAGELVCFDCKSW